MDWRIVIPAAAIAVLVLMAATGGAVWFLTRQTSAAPIASQTQRAAPSPKRDIGQTAPPTTFEDADEVVHWLSVYGLDCGEVDHVDGPLYATTMIDCGRTVVVAVYEDHPHAVRAVAALVALNGQAGNSTHVAIGSNWTVSSDDAWFAQTAAKRLGGTYQTA